MSPARSRGGRAGASAARLAAVQALYQMEMAGSSPAAAIADLSAGRLPAAEAGPADCDVDQELFRAIVEAAVERQEALDTQIARTLAEGWRLERLDAVARAILRAGVIELWARRETPAAVVIDEYVEIAKDFFDGPEPGFVNACLEASARTLRGDGQPG
ncbi:MAG: transcription antitermination factor NusB [Hyphomonadaceae bacterium]